MNKLGYNYSRNVQCDNINAYFKLSNMFNMRTQKVIYTIWLFKILDIKK